MYNTYVTNGYMTAEALALLVEAGLDAMNVDIKGDAAAVKKFCKAVDVEKVWATCRLARSHGVHLEITTLVIPAVNDSEAALRGLAQRVATELGTDVPWHVSGYYPAYQCTALATSLRVLERAWHIGRDVGLHFVYIGNVTGHRWGDTYCPDCGALLIERRGFGVLRNRLLAGHCPQCGTRVHGVWGKRADGHRPASKCLDAIRSP